MSSQSFNDTSGLADQLVCSEEISAAWRYQPLCDIDKVIICVKFVGSNGLHEEQYFVKKGHELNNYATGPPTGCVFCNK